MPGGVGLVFNSTANAKLVATDSGIILNPMSVQTKGESYVSLKQGEYINNPYPVMSFSGQLNLKTGITIDKKFEIYLSGVPLGVDESSSAYYSYSSKRIELGFNYLFNSANKKKLKQSPFDAGINQFLLLVKQNKAW